MPAGEWDGCPINEAVLAVALGAGALTTGTITEPILVVGWRGSAPMNVSSSLLASFLHAHAGATFVCKDAAHLHRVLQGYFRSVADKTGEAALWACSREYRLHDLPLLHKLLPDTQLARQLEADASTGVFAAQMADPERSVDLLMKVYKQFELPIMQYTPCAGPDREMIRKYGPFGIGIQVKAAIALDQASARGLRLPSLEKHRLLEELQRNRTEAVDCFRSVGERRRCAKPSTTEIGIDENGYPKLNDGKLASLLEHALSEVMRSDHGAFTAPTRLDGRVSLKPEDWGDLVRCHPHLSAWARMVKTDRLVRWLEGLQGEAVHPVYDVLRRCSSYKPDLQQLRALEHRGLFRPMSGGQFVVFTLPHLEFQALASACLYYGQTTSELAQVYREGIDCLHHTARSFVAAQLTVGEGPRAEHLAEAFLLAAARGWSAAVARTIAKLELGEEVSGIEAEKLYQHLTTFVYPELAEYLPMAYGTGGKPDGWAPPRRLVDNAMKEAVYALAAAGFDLVAYVSGQIVVEVAADNSAIADAVGRGSDIVEKAVVAALPCPIPIKCGVEIYSSW